MDSNHQKSENNSSSVIITALIVIIIYLFTKRGPSTPLNTSPIINVPPDVAPVPTTIIDWIGTMVTSGTFRTNPETFYPSILSTEQLPIGYSVGFIRAYMIIGWLLDFMNRWQIVAVRVGHAGQLQGYDDVFGQCVASFKGFGAGHGLTDSVNATVGPFFKISTDNGILFERTLVQDSSITAMPWFYQPEWTLNTAALLRSSDPARCFSDLLITRGLINNKDIAAHIDLMGGYAHSKIGSLNFDPLESLALTPKERGFLTAFDAKGWNVYANPITGSFYVMSKGDSAYWATWFRNQSYDVNLGYS